MNRFADAQRFLLEAAARKLERRRATARLPIGKKFRILEELRLAETDIAAIRAAARARSSRTQK